MLSASTKVSFIFISINDDTRLILSIDGECRCLEVLNLKLYPIDRDSEL